MGMMTEEKDLPFVSIVVIGMNEEENLDACFNAIEQMDYPREHTEVMYVDTGSIDRSVQIAKKYTGKVFVEKSKWPTAGLARNRGLLEAKYDIIHFIDGDIQVEKNYLKQAVKKLVGGDIQAVYGFLIEEADTGFNKLLAGRRKDGFDIKEGYGNATNGGGTYLKQALLEVNGYDGRIKKGQETELGERFRENGFKIWFLNMKMGVHNFCINGLADLCKRRYISGLSITCLMFLKGESNYIKSGARSALKGLIKNFGFIILFLIAVLKGFLVEFLLFLLAYFLYIVFKIRIIKKIKSVEYLKYILIMALTDPASFIGQLSFLVRYFFSGNRHVFSVRMSVR